MRKALILIVLPGFVSLLSIAEGMPHGKTSLHAGAARVSARPIAQVRVGALEGKGHGTWDLGKMQKSVLSPNPTVQSPTPALLPIVSQPDITLSDQIFLDHVLRQAPTLCRESIKHLVVRYPSTTLKPGDIERGQATASTMILRGPLAMLAKQEQAEMIGVIFHECGHIVDLGALQGSPRSGESAYPDGHVPTFNDDPSRAFYEISWETPTKLRRGARKEDFVSGYAKKSDAFEDLAESFVYYALHERAFRERAGSSPVLARKLAWLETHVFKDFHSPIASESWPAGRSSAKIAKQSEGWDGTIAWDVTKLEHMLEF